VKNVIVQKNLVYSNNSGGIRVGGYDAINSGCVKDVKLYYNTVANNGDGENGWNGELCFEKCDNVDVRGNIIYKDNEEYPLVGGDLGEEYVQNVKFNDNVFYSTAGKDAIYFEFAQKSLCGLNEFDEYVDGENAFGKPETVLWKRVLLKKCF
jgi:hypothetical protein